MTISSATSKAGPYSGNGSTTQFAFTFKTLTTTDLKVALTDSSGADTELALTTNYTVSLNADQSTAPGGVVTCLVAPATGEKLTILRNMTLTQESHIPNQGGFYPEVLEDSLDKLTMIVQQLNEQYSRTVQVGVTADPAAFVADIYAADDNAIAAAASAATAMGAATGALANGNGRRNYLLNGAMEVAQRGTSGTIKYTFSSQYAAFLCVDRWGFKNGGASDLGTASQVSAGLTGFSRALKVQRPNGSASTPQFRMAQALESIDAIRLQGKAVTLSFYAKAGANFSATLGRINALIAYETGSEQPTANFLGGSATAAVVSEDKTLNTAWQRFSLTGTVPAGAVQLAVRFAFTPTGTAGADDSVYITGVQLEEGALAMAFENRSYADELRLCQRHYFKARNTFNAGLALAAVVSGTSSVSVIRPPVPMRTIPIDLTYTNLADWYLKVGATSYQVSGVAVVGSGVADIDAIRIAWTHAGTPTAGQCGYMYSDGGAATLDFSTDL